MSLFKRILSRIADLGAGSDQVESGENPALRTAMLRYGKSKNAKNLDRLSSELTRANFLVPIFEASKALPKKKAGAKKKKVSGKKRKPSDDKIVFLYVKDESGRIFLPAFSHSQEVVRYFGSKTRTIRLEAADLWWAGLQNEEISGVVIDPVSALWILNREHLEILQKESSVPSG